MSTPVDHEVASAMETGAGNPVDQIGREHTTYELADPQTRGKIDHLIAEIDMGESDSVVFFGAKNQQQLTSNSERIADLVRNNHINLAVNTFNQMTAALRGFDVDALDPNHKQGLVERLLGKTKPLVRFTQVYEQVRDQIKQLSSQLESHKSELAADTASLSQLYADTLDRCHELEDYISAGEEELHQLDSEEIPSLERQVSQTQQLHSAQLLRDIRTNRDKLECRVHDIRLIHQAALQCLPDIRLVQENTKGLTSKIDTTLADHLPQWRQQLAQTFSETSTATEHAAFDIQAVKQANQTLIAAIEEALQIADIGKQRRLTAGQDLKILEEKLRRSLAASTNPGEKTAAP